MTFCVVNCSNRLSKAALVHTIIVFSVKKH